MDKNRETIYKTAISDTRWIAYDIPGNIGWIIWIICTVICLTRGAGIFSIISIIPSVLMLIGVVELISERITKLDRILPKARLYRGFGSLTFGGIIGIPVAIIGLITGSNGRLAVWMLIGAILCAVFAGLCFKGYKEV